MLTDARPSRTAVRAAILRAAHQLVDGEPKALADDVVVRLVAGLVRSDDGDLLAPAVRRLRAALVVRSRYAEDVLEDDVRSGVRQTVILGAGLDTFAYRQPTWARALRIVEVDHPATQAWSASWWISRAWRSPTTSGSAPSISR